MSKIALVVAILVVVLVGVTYWVFFGERVSFEAVSVSPDGMYKCQVKETYTVGQCGAMIKVYHRQPGDDVWKLLKEAEVYNDSVVRSNYSIDWEYDDKHRTRKLIVFGDFGGPPFPGEVILEMPFSSEIPAEASEQSEAVTKLGGGWEIRRTTTVDLKVEPRVAPPGTGDWKRVPPRRDRPDEQELRDLVGKSISEVAEALADPYLVRTYDEISQMKPGAVFGLQVTGSDGREYSLRFDKGRLDRVDVATE